MLEPKEILQINATILAGLFLLLVIIFSESFIPINEQIDIHSKKVNQLRINTDELIQDAITFKNQTDKLFEKANVLKVKQNMTLNEIIELGKIVSELEYYKELLDFERKDLEIKEKAQELEVGLEKTKNQNVPFRTPDQILYLVGFPFVTSSIFAISGEMFTSKRLLRALLMFSHMWTLFGFGCILFIFTYFSVI